MQINGKPLKQKQIELLALATEKHNAFYKVRQEKYKDITPEEYLEQLIEKQIAGLEEGINQAQQQEVDQSTRFDNARKRAGII